MTFVIGLVMIFAWDNIGQHLQVFVLVYNYGNWWDLGIELELWILALTRMSLRVGALLYATIGMKWDNSPVAELLFNWSHLSLIILWRGGFPLLNSVMKTKGCSSLDLGCWCIRICWSSWLAMGQPLRMILGGYPLARK